MHDGAYTLSLELEAPRLRREAFPWDVAEVELSAILSFDPTTRPTTAAASAAAAAAVVADCGRIINVRLPSVVDLSAFWPPGGAKDGTAGGSYVDQEEEHHLEVQISGVDLGITFTLGTASIQVPAQLKPSIAQNACRSTPFRVCLRDDSGARVGTVSGAFLARRGRAIDGPPSTAELAVAKQPEAGSAAAAVLRRQSDGDADRGCLLGATKTSEELATKHDNQDVFENKAIEMLDMASKILASANNSLANRPGCNPDGSTEETPASSAFEGHGEIMRSRLFLDEQKQATEVAEKIAPNDPEEDHAYGGAGVSRLTPKDKEREARAPRFPTAGFRFEPTTGSVAWHRIAAVNASKVERDGDLQTLKQFIADVAVGQVDGDDIDANPGLIKAFRLAQLQVQYVLHCQQILQRQCDGLQSTTTNMELEVEGNSQSTTAMKNRVRLLRKESRKQDKIISGYATMLRRHNPGLASKVRLDEKGRLRVFRVDEAAREWGGGGRRRRRNRSQRDIDGLQVLRVNNWEKGSSSNNGSPTRSSSPTIDDHSPANDSRSSTSDNRGTGEERSRFPPTSENHRARGSTRSAAGPHVEVGRESAHTIDREMKKSHQREGNTSIDVGVQEAFVSEGGGFGEADGGSGGSGGNGDNLEPRRKGGDNAVGLSRASVAPRRQDEGGGTTYKPEGGTHSSQAAIAAAMAATAEIGQTIDDNRGLDHPKVLSETPPEKGARNAITRRGSTHGAIRNISIAPNKTDRPGKLDGSTEQMSFSSPAVEDKKGDDSPGEGWQETERGATHDDGRPLSVVAQQGSKKYEAGIKGEDGPSGSRTPRLVTVSVKPRGMRQQSSPDNAALNSARFRGGEDSYAASPGGGQASQDSSASGSHPSSQGGGRDAGGEGESRFTQGVHWSTRDGVSRDRRPGEAGGEGRQGSSAAESSFSPSRLGIEGEGYPDALEFDLDDISEIDAGGEWAAGGGEGSLSS